jgi:DNA polymerase-4
VGVERTFSEDISDIDQLRQLMNEELIPELMSRSEKHLATRTISKLGVKVKFADFHQTTKEHKHAMIDGDVFATLLEEVLVRGGGKSVRLLGVHIGLNETGDGAFEQFELFH